MSTIGRGLDSETEEHSGSLVGPDNSSHTSCKGNQSIGKEICHSKNDGENMCMVPVQLLPFCPLFWTLLLSLSNESLELLSL